MFVSTWRRWEQGRTPVKAKQGAKSSCQSGYYQLHREIVIAALASESTIMP